jgi:hypothetical protein
MTRRKIKADCRADTRGEPWAGIPICVIKSPAYRDCSVHARAILVELVARMNGYNNGKIAVSQRELVDGIGCSPRKIVRGIAELMEHALIDVETDGKWKERMAREYRLTFVSTKTKSATNDYLHWQPRIKTGATAAVAETRQSGSDAVAPSSSTDSDAAADARKCLRKIPSSQNRPAADAVSLICKPYVGLEVGASMGWCRTANVAE